MGSLRSSRLGRFAGLVLAFGVALTSSAGAETPWDQKAVTDLASKLATALKDLNHTVQKNPDQPSGSPARRAQFQAREDLKMLVSTAQRLAIQLKAGDDKDATMPTYKRVLMIRRDAEENGKKGQVPAPTLEKVVSAKALLDQLAPYYEDGGSASAPPPATEGATP